MANEIGSGVLPPSFARVAHLFRCPVCGGSISVVQNEMACVAGHTFEIRDGVPRFVRDPELSEHRLPDQTSRAFGSQWIEIGDLATVSDDDLRLHLPDSFRVEDTFKGLVLDAGCGMGRYTALATQRGATAIGLDLSRAVDKAARLWPDLTFVQADLSDPPLQPRSFDLVFSFGVLHHLPDPKAGFQECFALVKPEGRLLVWVYSAHGGLLRWMRRRFRAITRRFPVALRPIAWTAAAGLWCGYVWPSRLLSRRKALRFYANKGFAQLYVDCHDALTAPVEVYLTAEDCREWLRSIEPAKSGFELRRDGTGWVIWAIRSN